MQGIGLCTIAVHGRDSKPALMIQSVLLRAVYDWGDTSIQLDRFTLMHSNSEWCRNANGRYDHHDSRVIARRFDLVSFC